MFANCYFARKLIDPAELNNGGVLGSIQRSKVKQEGAVCWLRTDMMSEHSINQSF